jgi:hypothetical protein
VSVQPTPALAANLTQNCANLPFPPTPLIDPDRAIWESMLIALYGDCAAKHRYTVEAWPAIE